MVYILTILTCLLGCGTLVGIKILFAFELTSFSLFFIVPVGAMFSSAAICSGYPFGIKKNNIKPSKGQVITVLILAALMFFVLQYGYYMVTYLDEDYHINYRFQGDHISEFVFIDSGKEINFLRFLVHSINTQTITFSYRSLSESVEANKVVNWVFFVLDFIGFLAGGYIIYYYLVSSAIYCDNCNKYMKKKKMIRLTGNIQEKLNILKESIENKDISRIKELIQSNVTEKKPEEMYVDTILNYCEDCNDGYLIFEFFVETRKGKFVQDGKRTIKVRIDNEIVKNLVQ